MTALLFWLFRAFFGSALLLTVSGAPRDYVSPYGSGYRNENRFSSSWSSPSSASADRFVAAPEVRPLRTISFSDYEQLVGAQQQDAGASAASSSSLSMPSPPLTPSSSGTSASPSSSASSLTSATATIPSRYRYPTTRRPSAEANFVTSGSFATAADADGVPMMASPSFGFVDSYNSLSTEAEVVVAPLRVSCPPPSVYDRATESCLEKRAPTRGCPEGFRMSGLDMCLKTETVPGEYSCPDGGEADNAGLCVITQTQPPKCPSGFTLLSSEYYEGVAAARCAKEVPVSSVCEAGFTLLRDGTCEARTTVPALLSCGEGTELDEQSKSCVAEVPLPPQCPEGFTKKVGDRDDVRCVKHVAQEPADCPSGYVAKNADTCVSTREFPAEKACPLGFKYDETEDICLKAKAVAPVCPFGFVKSEKYASLCEREVESTSMCPVGTELMNTATESSDGQGGVEERLECVRRVMHEKFLRCRAGFQLVEGKCKRVERTPPVPTCVEGELRKDRCEMDEWTSAYFSCPDRGFDLAMDLKKAAAGEGAGMPVCSKLVKKACPVKGTREECVAPEELSRLARPVPEYREMPLHGEYEVTEVVEWEPVPKAAEIHMLAQHEPNYGYRPLAAAQRLIKRFLLPEETEVEDKPAGDNSPKSTTTTTERPRSTSRAGGASRSRTTTTAVTARTTTDTKKPTNRVSTTKKAAGTTTMRPGGGATTTTTKKPADGTTSRRSTAKKAASSGATTITTKKTSSGATTTRATTRTKAGGAAQTTSTTTSRASGSAATTAGKVVAMSPVVKKNGLDCREEKVEQQRNCTQEETKPAKVSCPEGGELSKKDGQTACKVRVTFDAVQVCEEGDKDEATGGCVRILYLPAEYYCPVGEDAGGMKCVELETYPASFVCPKGTIAERIPNKKGGKPIRCVERVPDTPQPPQFSRSPVEYTCPQSSRLVDDRIGYCAFDNFVARLTACPPESALTFKGTCVITTDLEVPPPKRVTTPALKKCPEGSAAHGGSCSIVAKSRPETTCPGNSEVMENGRCRLYAEAEERVAVVKKAPGKLMCPEGSQKNARGTACEMHLTEKTTQRCPAGYELSEVDTGGSAASCVRFAEGKPICPMGARAVNGLCIKVN